jgi:hypothetical protein
MSQVLDLQAMADRDEGGAAESGQCLRVRAAPAHRSRHAELSAAMDDEELTSPSADEL